MPHMPHMPHEHETFCTIDQWGFVTTHDTLEDAERAVVVDVDGGPATHLYVGRFIPFRPHRLTLRQARAIWLASVVVTSVTTSRFFDAVHWLP